MSKNTTTSTRDKNVPFEYENAYEECKELVLDDGVTKVVLNATGRKGEITSELK